VRYAYGFQPGINHLAISPAAWHPFTSLELNGLAHGHRIHLVHSFGNVTQREVHLDGQVWHSTESEELSDSKAIHFSYDDLSSDAINEISVTDPA
jgi:hypothetical protein